MKKTIVIILLIAVTLKILTGCQSSSIEEKVGYATLEEALLDYPWTEEVKYLEIVSQATIDDYIFVSYKLSDDLYLLTTLAYENNLYYYTSGNYSKDFIEKKQDNLNYTWTGYSTVINENDDILINIVIIEEQNINQVTDSLGNTYSELEYMNPLFVMVLDEMPDGYLIYINGEEYTLV